MEISFKKFKGKKELKIMLQDIKNLVGDKIIVYNEFILTKPHIKRCYRGSYVLAFKTAGGEDILINYPGGFSAQLEYEKENGNYNLITKNKIYYIRGTFKNELKIKQEILNKLSRENKDNYLLATSVVPFTCHLSQRYLKTFMTGVIATEEQKKFIYKIYERYNYHAHEYYRDINRYGIEFIDNIDNKNWRSQS